jgi:hypothetical protein
MKSNTMSFALRLNAGQREEIEVGSIGRKGRSAHRIFYSHVTDLRS